MISMSAWSLGADKVLAFVFCMHGLHMDWELERMFPVS